MRDVVLGSAPFFQRGLLDDIVEGPDDIHLPSQHALVPPTLEHPDALDPSTRNLERLLDDSAAPESTDLDLLHPGPFWARVDDFAAKLTQIAPARKEVAAAVALLHEKLGMRAMLSAHLSALLQA